MPTSESAEAAAHHPAPSDTNQATGYRLLQPDAVPGQPRQKQAEGVDQEQATARREKDDALTTEVQRATGPEAAWEPAPSVTVRPLGTSLDSSRPRASERLRPDTHSAVPPLENFVTTQGGLFFLLNFLKREEVQLRIQQASPEEGLTSGWGWLYRLGKELALDENDPIAGFLALQMGLDHPEALANLPPLPAREHLLNLAGQLYSRHGIWQPDLLRLNARVHYTSSHVDLYASLQSVRMPVRLAGLDLDPCWLPWLGRVVAFTYE